MPATMPSDDGISPELHHPVMTTLTARLAAEVPDLVRRTLAELEASHPQLVERLGEEALGRAAERTHRRGAEHLAGVADGLGPEEHVDLGATAARAGLSLEEVTAGYRVGGRLMWARATALAAELGAPAAVAFALAERHIAYVDRLTHEALAGFARAAGSLGAERARERQALVEALLGGAPEATIAARAAAVVWPLPPAVVVGLPLGEPGPPPEHLLAGRHEGVLVLVADAARLGAWTGVAAARGPATPLRRASASLRGARRVAALAELGVLRPDAPAAWDEQLVALVVHGDGPAGAALAREQLGALAGLPAARAAMLRETLAAWLRHPGRPQAIAAELHLHPQTARYRIGRLREHLGAALDDPERRFALDLALRAEAAVAR